MLKFSAEGFYWHQFSLQNLSPYCQNQVLSQDRKSYDKMNS